MSADLDPRVPSHEACDPLDVTAMGDSDKLRVLATWFDAFDDWRELTGRIAPGISEYREVQNDLRRIADEIEPKPDRWDPYVHAGWLAVALAVGLVVGAMAASAVRGSEPSGRAPQGTGLGPAVLTPADPSGPADGPTPSPELASPSATSGHAQPSGAASVAVPAPSRRPVSPRRAASTALEAPRGKVSGVATWYRWRPGEAAAGPELRRALGSHWRGRVVLVDGIRVRLTDWCLCTGRLIDLDARSFSKLAPLSRGVVEVTISW